MNLELQILKEHSKRNTVKIARWIGEDAERFALLMQIFLTGEYRLVQRSAWILSACVEQHPMLIRPWLKMLLARIEDATVHNAVRRNGLRILQFVSIPRSLQGRVVNLCFNQLHMPESPIAVKVFAMTVLRNIALQEPELKREVIYTIQEIMPYSAGGIAARGKRVLAELSLL